MKKTYMQPTTTIHDVEVERSILTASEENHLIIFDDEEVESVDVLSRSFDIWDNEDE